MKRSVGFALFVLLLLGSLAAAPATTAVRLGYQQGDDWEPAVAADRFGHVYALWNHYGDDPACPGCPSPHMELQVSADGGTTWSDPRPLVPDAEARQDDPQIAVDPIDGRTVFAAYMLGNKSSQYVARSDDFGASWEPVLVEDLQRGTDKDVLAVRGDDVYLVYNAVQKIYASVSHDGGATWSLERVVSNTNSTLGWSLPGGGAVDSSGSVYFAWEGFTQNGKPAGVVHIFVSKSSDGGKTWTVQRIDTSQAPPRCSTCGWAYWGPGTSVAIDDEDHVYVLYNANRTKYGPNRMFLAVTSDGGETWSRQDVSLAPVGANNVFPAVLATGHGHVRVAWTDDREAHDDGSADGSARWNVYTRTSADGGETWSGESIVSSYESGYAYLFPDGFNEPYGDYLEMDRDAAGRVHIVWGEGPSYWGPGNVWYARL